VGFAKLALLAQTSSYATSLLVWLDEEIKFMSPDGLEPTLHHRAVENLLTLKIQFRDCASKRDFFISCVHLGNFRYRK